jgi:signal transduction histidine kinase
MTRAPGSYWSFWPNPHADFFGKASYEWNFLLKVDLPIVLGLLVLFSLPPVQAWTGCDVRILAVAFLSQFLFGAFVNLYGYDRISAGAREFGSHLTNVLAVVAIPLSTEKAMFALWALYPLIVWMDGYGSPKSVSSLLTSVSIPWLDPLWHRDAPTFESKLLLTGLSVGLGIVIYLVSSYFAAWAREGARRAAEAERERALQAERERIGQSLHGTLGAALSEISLWHEIALAGTASPDTEPLSRAQARARSALTELRALVAGLDGEDLAAAQLCAGVRRQIDGLCAAANVRLTFTGPDSGSRDMASAYHIAKIIVEGVTNAVRHSGATTVQVALGLSPLSIVIRDDGTGFDPGSAPRGRGVRSLYEHAEALHGSLHIESAPGRGTTIRFQSDAPSTVTA